MGHGAEMWVWTKRKREESIQDRFIRWAMGLNRVLGLYYKGGGDQRKNCDLTKTKAASF